jgi:hypothetical protein
MSYTSALLLLLHLIYLSYLSNVYRACSFFVNSELFCIDNARIIKKYGIINYLCMYDIFALLACCNAKALSLYR